MAGVFKGIRNFFSSLFVIIALISFGVLVGVMKQHGTGVHKSSILVMDLSGIILDGRQFLEDLRKYAKEDQIKGVLVRVNSPGGVVGPSQEIYSELKRVREELKKPVVVTCEAVSASGAYYASVAADKIFTNPGCLMGSIGVIMEFANLERLYDWAKIERYSLKTGAYKDAGADYRRMTADEKRLFQEMIDGVQAQFKEAVQTGRKLEKGVVDQYADGRVFTGAKAVELGFADTVGTYRDALREVGKLSGLGDDPEVFEPPVKRPSLFEFMSDMSEQSLFKGVAKQVFPTQLLGKPLYLMPGSVLER